MSDYGLNIKNTSGNTLISSATAQAAFYSKIPYTNAVYQKQVYAFPNWGYVTPMKPVVFVKYTFECSGIPIIFIRPRMFKGTPYELPPYTYYDIYSSRYITEYDRYAQQSYYSNALYAIISQNNIGGNTWEIELVIKTRAGYDTYEQPYEMYTFFPDGQPITWQQIEDAKLIPDLFIFTKQEYAPTVDNSQYGLMVRDYNNNINFDSRKRTLIITGSYYENMLGPCRYPDGRGIKPYPPGTPMTINGAQWNDSSLWLIDLDNRNLQSNIRTGYIKAFPRNLAEKRRDYRYQDDICPNVMFHAPVVAQAYTEYTKNGYKKSCGKHGMGGCQEHWSTAKWGVVSRLCVGIVRVGNEEIYNSPTGAPINNKYSLYDNSTRVTIQRAFAATKLMYSFTSAHEGTNWYNGGNSSGGYAIGTAPYPAQVINRNGFHILYSDASFYEF